MTYGLVSVQGHEGPLIQVKITKKDKRGTATGWVGGWVATVWVATAAYRGGHLIQVTNTVFV